MSELGFHPVSPERVDDLTRFCEKRGRFGNGRFAWCSCMRWRMPAGQFQASTPAERTAALVDLVGAGVPVGVLAYDGSEPIGWCSVAPRETYEALERSRALPRIDDAPVWSVVCFFVNGRFRRQGLTGQLLAAAVDYAGSQGALAVEGYPVEPGPRSYTYMGSPATFAAAGFGDVTPAGQHRRVARLALTRPPS